MHIDQRIREILLHDWGPNWFGDVLARDEQDNSIAPVLQILTGSRSEEDLVKFLFRTARDTIVMPCTPREHYEQLRPVARELLELKTAP